MFQKLILLNFSKIQLTSKSGTLASSSWFEESLVTIQKLLSSGSSHEKFYRLTKTHKADNPCTTDNHAFYTKINYTGKLTVLQ